MKIRQQTFRTLFFLFLLMCLLSGLVGIVKTSVSAAPQFVPSTNIVISQVYGGGGNAGATYTNDFVELFNLNTTTAVSLNGWSIQYAPAASAVWQVTTLPNVSIAAGQYYLIQLGSGGINGVALPTPDTTGVTNMAAGAGKVALVNTTVALAGSGCPFAASVVDFIGYGATANCFETAFAPAPSATLSDLRISSGCTDNDNNSSDFVAVTPTPRNTISPVNICPPPTPTSTPTYTPTNTNTPTLTFTPSLTPIFSPTPTLTPTPGDVIISEVAWSGTQASSSDEWIELYNILNTPINLTGWRLVNFTGSVDIVINGVIPANGFFLLERARDLTVSDVVADQIYSGALGDTNDSLTLSKPNGTVSDTANSDLGAWPAGTGSPNFYSMERVVTGGVPAPDTASGWISNTNVSTWTKHDAAGSLIHGTPAGSNWGFTVTSTATPMATSTPTRTATPTRTNTPGLCTAGAAPSSVLINEIAWAGTGASSSDQWIELYNPTASLVNLNSWILRAVDGTPNIALANVSLAAGQYYLLERTADTTVSDVAANQIFTGAIGTSNEVLQLYNASGICVDTANSNGGAWPAGNSSTHATMERRGIVHDSDTAWITNANSASWLKHDSRGTGSTNYLIHGTPGYGNWAFTVTATPSPIPTQTRVPTKYHTSTPVPVYVPPPPLVAINEFVPRPGHDWNNDGVINTGDEYIEVLNHGVIDVNLSGYSLDDEANIGSSPFSLPAVTLKPGQRMVFYGSQTGIHLDDGGDGVRLIKPNGQLADAYNYPLAEYPDQAYCRLPDNGGLDDWNTNCYPTPGLPNALNAALPPPVAGINSVERACPIADNLPLDFVLAECPSFGNIWSRFFWDAKGWFGEKFIPDNNSKWDSYVD